MPIPCVKIQSSDLPGVKGMDLTSQFSHGVIKRKVKPNAGKHAEKDSTGYRTEIQLQGLLHI